MKPRDRLTVFLVVLLILVMLPPASPEMAESAVSAESVSPVSSSPNVEDGDSSAEEVSSSVEGSCPTCASTCSSATIQGGLAPLPPRSDLPGEALRYGTGLAVATGSGAVTYGAIELAIPGRGPALQVSLNYHSLYRQGDDGWGYGWSFNRDWRYQLEPNGDVTVLLARGIYDFASDGQGGFISATSGMTLTWQSDALLLNRANDESIFFGEPTHRHVTRWEDANGAALTFTYDGDGQLTAISNGQGRQITLTYLDGRLRTILDAGSAPERRLQLDYSPGGDLVAVTDSLNQTTQLTYDVQHRLTQVTDSRGDQTTVVYDGDYAVEVTPGGLTTSILLGSAGDTITIRETDERGVTRERILTYDYRDLLASTTYPDGSTIAQNFDDVQHQFSETDENGGITVTRLDANNQVNEVRDPEEGTTSFTYDPSRGYLTGVIDPNGNTTTFEYDQAGNLTATVDPLGHRFSYAYDESGDMVGLTNPLSHSVSFDYDQNGLLTGITNALGAQTMLSYNQAGNLVSITDGNGHTTGFGHDALGRTTTIIDALGFASAMAYDGAGNLTYQSDPDGRITRYAYDGLGHRTVITDAFGGETQLAYDAWGNLTTLTDAEGHPTGYTYDARDRMTSQTDPLGQTKSYRYDAMGNRVGVTTPAGQVITSSFDAANRLTRVDTPGDDDAYFFYDRAGRTTTAGDANAEIGYTYDAASRLTTVSYGYDGAGFAPLELDYAYDAAGHRVSAMLPDGQDVGYEYDAADRLTAVIGGNTRYELTYDNGDRLTQRAPGAGQPGVRTNYAYDAANRLTALANAIPDDATVLDTFNYTFDHSGNVLAAVHNGETTGYAYDALQRLTEVTLPGGAREHYNYDSVGNRLQLAVPSGTVSYTYDAADQLLSIADTRGGTPVVTTFTYDANGNLSTRTDEAGSTTYTWDAANRLERITSADGTYIAYTYGPDGQRLARRDRAGNVVYFVYDGLNLVQERDPSGNVLASYVYGGELDRPYSMIRSGQTYYYLFDRLGSVIGLTDGASSVVARYEYDAWGNLRAESGTVVNPFRYAGREWDAEAKIYYNRARYYDPALGRFLSRDPLGPVDGTNLYVYAVDNPLAYTDAMGTSSNASGEDCNKCKCFNDCAKAVTNTTIMSVISTLNKLLKIPSLFTKPEEKLIESAISSAKDAASGLVGDSEFDCVDKWTRIISEIAAGVERVVGANNDLVKGPLISACAASAVTGVGAVPCSILAAVAATRLALSGVQSLVSVGALAACEFKCTGDKEEPRITVSQYTCSEREEYEISVYDNCGKDKLVEDPSGIRPALSQPQPVTARDRSGNVGRGTVPACRKECHVQKACSCGEYNVWNQETCSWSCVSHTSSPPTCNCGELVPNPEGCGWTCKSDPPPAGLTCGTNKCGQSLPPSQDPVTCDWDCEGKTNNPCNPDDTRSTAGLELPGLTSSSTSRWTIANAFAEPSASLLPEPEPAVQYSAAATGSAAPTPGSGIAILDNGFSISLQDFLGQQGVAADRVPPDFSPDMAGRYPALFVPSGGLSGYAGSELMRQRLGQYVGNGGVLVVFAQEYGDEFALLPGGVGGYGFDEDLNCHANSAQIVTFAPMLLGQSREVLSLNIDGFFTNWPAGAETLLSRMANGMPAMLSYPYGSGRVVATTAYADMAYYEGQGTPEEKILLRDLARWALAPDLATDKYGPNDQVTVLLTLTNQTAVPVDRLSYDVGDPWGRSAISETHSLPALLNPGETTHFTLTVGLGALSLPEKDRYGLWSVDVTLLDSAGSVTQEIPDTFRFAVTRFVGQEDGYSYLGQPYALSVTSVTEEYPKGEPATFTYHVFNHSDQEEIFNVGWYLTHHSWYHVPGYQGFAWVTVPGHSMGSVESTLDRVMDLDRLHATLRLHGQRVAYAQRGFWVAEPEISQTITPDKGIYDWGDRPVVTIITSNSRSMPITVTTFLQVVDPDSRPVLTETRTSQISGVPSAFITTLPPLIQPGYYGIEVSNSVSGREVLHAGKSLYLIPSRLDARLDMPDRISPGTPITLTVSNRGDRSDPPSTAVVSLTNPSGTLIWSGAQDLPALAMSQAVTAAFSLNSLGALALGDNTLAYLVRSDDQALAYGRTVIPARLAMEGEFDKPAYRVRDTLFFSATLHNTGRFDLTPLAEITAPSTGLNVTHTATLPAGSDATIPISTTLPGSLSPGSYSLYVSAQHGTTVARDWTFVVPPSKLDARLRAGPYIAGEPLEVAIRNDGGVDTTAAYNLSLTGVGAKIAQADGTIEVQAGTGVTLTLHIPMQAASGHDYVLQATVHDQETGSSSGWSRSLTVQGISAVVAAAAELPAYLSGDIITATGVVSVTSGTIVDAPLELSARRAALAGWEASLNSGVSDDASTASQGTPAIAVDAAGNAYSIWQDYRNGNYDIYFAYRPVGGTWGANVRVNDDMGTSVQGSPTIAVDGIGNAYAAWWDYRNGNFDIYFAYRPAGGTWGANVRVNDDTGTASQENVALAADAEGNAYAVWNDNRTGNNDIYFAYRPAGGTWGASTRINGDTGTAYQADPDIAVDAAGNAYAAWQDNRNGNANTDVYFAYRPAGGTWGANVRINGDGGTAYQYSPDLAVDSVGNAYAVWEDSRSGNQDIYFAYRPAGGSWGANVRVNDDTGTAHQQLPALALDATGNAYAVWMDRRGGNSDIYFAYRPAGGTWTTNLRVNDDMGTATQDSAAIGVDAIGNIYAVWQDLRNGNADIFFAYRPANGTWDVNERICDDPGTASQGNPAVAIDPAGNAYAAWADQRNINNSDDIYFAYQPAGGSWSPNVSLQGGATSQVNPTIAVDPAGNAYAVWNDNGTGDNDVYFAYWPAGGAWGASVRINDDTNSASKGPPAIAVDGAGNAYAVWHDNRTGDDDVYFAYRPAGGTWGANVRVSDDPGTNSQYAPALAVDAAGNAYAVWEDNREGNDDIYFAYRPAGGMWSANVRLNDGTGTTTQYAPAIAVDEAGNAYAVWEDDRNGNYDIYFAYRPASGAWGANLRVNDDAAGTSGHWYPAIATDAAGNAYAAWVDERNDSGDIYLAYLPAGGTWTANVRVNDDQGTANQAYPAVAVDAEGKGNVVWEDYRSGNADIYFSVVRPLLAIVWSRPFIVTTDTVRPIDETIGTLNSETGKFYLDAKLRNELGQLLSTHSTPFYIYPPGVALTLETDRPAYRPGDTIQISGRVTNTAVLPATIPLAVTADADLLLSRSLTLAPGAGESYSTNVTATDSFNLAATAGTASASEPIAVAAPQIEASLHAPSVVGRAPFTATVAITNTGVVSASLMADFGGQVTRDVTLASGERTLLEASLVITADSELAVDLSGDITQTLTQLITQGEQVSLSLGLPEESVWAGPVAVSYLLTNEGLLPSSVPLSIALDDTAVLTREITTLAGQVLTDELVLDLSPGVHCLAAAIPDQQAGGCVTVQDPEAALVRIDEALIPARLVGREPLTVTLTNLGPGPFDGALRAETTFDLAEVPFSLDAGATQVLTATLASDNAPAGGTYTVTLGAWVNAALHSRLERSLEVPAPELQASMPDIMLVPGSDLIVPMTVYNPGGVGVPFTMTLDLHGLYAADRIGWAGPGETVPVSYTIALPADIEARTDIGHYTLNGVQTSFTYTIAGYQLDMSAHLSSLMASAGQPVTATISITDTSGLGQPIPLRVQLAGAGEPQTEAITLTGSAQTTFVVTAPVQSALLSYGLYHPEGRSVLLDTLRLYVQGELFSLHPDRGRYLAGETMQLTAQAAVTGTLTWQTFAISQTLALLPNVPATISVPLASDLTAGTYRVWYEFTATDGRWVQDEVPIDVIGDRIEIRQVNLDRSTEGIQEIITATMRLRSLTALNDVVLTGRIIAPDDSELTSETTTLNLPVGATWVTLPPMTFTRSQVGSYRLRYELTQDGRDLASGRQAFDVIGPVVLGVHVPRAYFLDTQPVTFTVTVLNHGALPATLTVFVDGEQVQEQTVAEAGQQTIAFDLGVLSTGQHALLVSLTDSNGLSGRGTATIPVRQLSLQMQMPPPDGLDGWHVITPTIWLWPDIAESAAHYRWDGGVPRLAIDNEAELPADGQHELTAWAELPDGTSGSSETATLWLDRKPPSVTASIQTGRPVAVSLSATDDASGLYSIDYWDAGTWHTYTVPLTFTAVQATTLFYRARDRAGNDSGVREVQVPPAEPAYGLTLSADTDSQEGAPGATVAYALIITNTGVAADTFTVQSAGNAWPSRGPLEVGPLDAGRSARFVVAVDIPAGVTPNETDTSTWTVLSQGNPSQSAGQSLITQARVTYGLAIEAGRTTRSAAPGGAVSYQVRVTNQGNVVESFDVAVTGNAWPVNAPSVVGPLAPGAHADLDVTVQVPVTAISGESDTATVSVSSQADATQSANIVFNTEAAVSQGNTSPLAPAVSASHEGAGVKLMWQHLVANDHYEVWRNVSPYFDPNDPNAGAIKLEDVYPPTGVGDVIYVDTNPPPVAYYVVRGVNGTGQVSGISNRIGRFSFDLVPDQ